MKSIQTKKVKGGGGVAIFKANQQDFNIVSNLILTGLLIILKQERHVFTRIFFNNMFLVKLIKNSQYFLFQLVIQNIQVKWNFCFVLPMLRFNKMTQMVVVLAAWILILSTLWNMLLQWILQGEMKCPFLFKNMATQAGLNFQLQLFLTNEVTKSSSVLDKRSYN